MSKQYKCVEFLRWNTRRWHLILARAGGVHRYCPLLTGLVLSLLTQLHLLVEACEPPSDPGLHFFLVALELLWFCLEDIKTMFLLSENPPGITHDPFCVPVVFSVYCSFWIHVIVAFLLVIVLLSFELSDTEMNLPAHKSPLQCFGVARWVSPMSPRTKWEMQLTGAAYRNAFFSRVPKALYLGSFAL